MRQKVAKKLNKLAEALMLTRGERRKLKSDWHKTPNRNLKDLEDILNRVDVAIELKGQENLTRHDKLMGTTLK